MAGVFNVSMATLPEDIFSDAYHKVQMTRQASLIAGIYMVIVIFLGVMENVLVLNTIRRHPQIVPLNGQLVKFLCMCDLSMAILSLPFICTSCIANEWLFSDIGCQWYGFSMTVSGLMIIATLACIAFQRYHVIVGMRQDSENVTKRRTKLVIIGCFVYGTCFGLLPFFGVGSYALEPVFLSCSPTWWSKEPSDVVFVIILFIVAFLLPVGLIMFSYTCICIKVFTAKGQNRRALHNNGHIKIAVVSFLMIVSFLVSWGPYTVMAFLQVYNDDFKVSPIANTVPIMMAKSCIIWDPIIYFGGNEMFRKAFLNDLSHFATNCRLRFHINSRQKSQSSASGGLSKKNKKMKEIIEKNETLIELPMSTNEINQVLLTTVWMKKLPTQMTQQKKMLLQIETTI